MFGTRYSGSGAATGMQICAQVASPRGSISPYCRYFAGERLFPFDLHRHGLQKLAPWLIAQKITYVSFYRLRCCEPGLRRYPTIFGFRRSVSSGRRASGSTQKTLFASPGISKAIGASDIAIRRQRPELSRPRSSPLRVFPTLVSSRLAVRSMGWKSA